MGSSSSILVIASSYRLAAEYFDAQHGICLTGQARFQFAEDQYTIAVFHRKRLATVMQPEADAVLLLAANPDVLRTMRQFVRETWPAFRGKVQGAVVQVA